MTSRDFNTQLLVVGWAQFGCYWVEVAEDILGFEFCEGAYPVWLAHLTGLGLAAASSWLLILFVYFPRTSPSLVPILVPTSHHPSKPFAREIQHR
jgi:hypothetical protein